MYWKLKRLFPVFPGEIVFLLEEPVSFNPLRSEIFLTKETLRINECPNINKEIIKKIKVITLLLLYTSTRM